MTTRLSKSRAGQSGFTLVELLVAITVIAILVGMLSAAVIPVLARAKEMAIVVQMKQIEQSIENFNNEFDFYPPSWVSVTNDGALGDVASATKLLHYINRIAPNHREGVADSAGVRPVDLWWAEVGQYIEADHGDDLVFWLSGLGKNAQFPLTNGMATGFAGYNNGGFERNVFFEFPSQQLDIHDNVASFQQRAGSEEANWLYIDARSYGLSATYDGYHVLNEIGGTPGVRVYENANSFQLICPGLDEEYGPGVQWAIQRAPGYEGLTDFIDQNNGAAGLDASDNICNFTEGRLSLVTEGSRDSSAVK